MKLNQLFSHLSKTNPTESFTDFLVRRLCCSSEDAAHNASIFTKIDFHCGSSPGSFHNFHKNSFKETPLLLVKYSYCLKRNIWLKFLISG